MFHVLRESMITEGMNIELRNAKKTCNNNIKIFNDIHMYINSCVWS